MDNKVSCKNDSSSDCNGLKVKLLVTKTDESVIHAEVSEEFCDIVFSFLTLPLGHVVKLLGGSSSIACIDNLHNNMQKNMSGYFKSDECRDMVLSPDLAPFFSCGNHFLVHGQYGWRFFNDASSEGSDIRGRHHHRP